MNTESRPGYIHPQQEKWGTRLLRRVPEPWRATLDQRWRARMQHETWRAANIDLLQLSEELRPQWLRLAASDAAVNALAVTMAAATDASVRRLDCDRKAVALIARACAVLDIQPPSARLKSSGTAPAIARATDPRWWRRSLRYRSGRAVEHAAATLGEGPSRAAPYCTDLTLKRRRQQHARNRATLAGLVAVSSDGDRIDLSELADKSGANPINRSAEMLVRLRGIERTADQAGDACIFVTLTAPGHMHPRTNGARSQNPSWTGETPAAAQAHLARVWARTRAELARHNITARGMRVAEPHKDGTPHWHLLIWLPPDQSAQTVHILRKHAIADTPDEPGAAAHRLKVEHIDRARGSAVGYVIKYLAKHLPSKGARTVGDDADEGDAPQDARDRIDAWAAVWSIRRFQFFGVAPVTLWRELRRRQDDDTPDPGPTLTAAATAAETPDWSAFEQIAGPVPYQRARATITQWMEPAEPTHPGTAATDRYGEARPDRLVGLYAIDGHRRTRMKTWSIQAAPERRAA